MNLKKEDLALLKKIKGLKVIIIIEFGENFGIHG
jgi:hypothetical protein